MDKLQKTFSSAYGQTQSSVPLKTLNIRISSLFHKSETFEKKFSKRLDKIIPLTIAVYTNSEKYKSIKDNLARNPIQISDEDAYRERAERSFIKRFENNYNRKHRSMDKLLNMIKNNKDLNKALEMIDHRLGSTGDPLKQLEMAKIKDVLNETFNPSSYDLPNSSTKKLVGSKFVPTLPTLLEEESPI